MTRQHTLVIEVPDVLDDETAERLVARVFDLAPYRLADGSRLAVVEHHRERMLEPPDDE